MQKLMRRLNIISRCTGIFRTDQLRGTGLGACHHSLLYSIYYHPGISQEELAKRVYINKSNVTRHLAQIEELGYVDRRQSEADKRVILVYPTDKLKELFPVLKRITGEWNDYLTEGFNEEELSLFSSMLDVITQRAQKYVDERVE